MRIISGKFGSRPVKAVPNDNTRPTTDKIKEAIFSRIGPYFDGGCMLDLFAGSGAMSLEAISRGMTACVLVDINHLAIQVIKENISTFQVLSQCEIWKCDYKQALDKCKNDNKKFDLVFLDPPYVKQEIDWILVYLDENGLLNDDCDIICETSKEFTFEQQIGTLIKQKEVIYGITKITYYKKEI